VVTVLVTAGFFAIVTGAVPAQQQLSRWSIPGHPAVLLGERFRGFVQPAQTVSVQTGELGDRCDSIHTHTTIGKGFSEGKHLENL